MATIAGSGNAPTRASAFVVSISIVGTIANAAATVATTTVLFLVSVFAVVLVIGSIGVAEEVV